MANYDDYKTTLNYLLASALDDLEQEDSEYCLNKQETWEVENYVQDNDCDIINELIDCMKQQIRDKVEEIVENRHKAYDVCFNITAELNLTIGVDYEEQLDKLLESREFKRYIINSLDFDYTDIEIDNACEGSTDWIDLEAHDYL